MPFVVDGYNLIYRDRRLSDVIDERGARAARDGLVAVLASFADASRREVTVVFDGAKAEDPTLPRRVRKGAVEIRYSDFGVTADRVIEEMIELHPAPAELYVVSDDKSVAKAIEARGAHGVPVDDFLERVRRAFRKRRHARARRDEKPSDVSNSDVDYWLRAMGLSDEEESER